MNILLISNIYPEPLSYGIKPDTKAIHYFALEWKKQGHNVIVVHPYWNALGNIKRLLKRIINRTLFKADLYDMDDIPVLFKESQIFLPHRLSPFSFIQKQSALIMKRRLERDFPEFVPDVVIVHFPFCSVNFNSIFIRNRTSVGTMHGADIRILHRMSAAQRSHLVDLLNKQYKHIFFRSKVLRESGLQVGIKDDDNNIILSGIDKNLFVQKINVETKWANERIKYSLAFAGKLNKQKSVDTIIRAIAILKERYPVTLNIIGEGEEETALKKLAAELNISDVIIFHGRLSREDVMKIFDQSGVFVMVSRNETLGLVYLESMCRGCVAIGSKNEGIDGIIKDGENGFLCDPENSEFLSEKLKNIFELPLSPLRKIALNGFNTVEDLTSEKIAEDYLLKI